MGRPRKFNREDVLEKVIPVFWSKGFADTSLQDLEKATNVNKSGLYSEFQNKDDLFLASLRYYTENRGARKALAAEPLGWGNIENFFKVGQTCRWGQKGCFAVNSMRELAVLPVGASEIVQESRAILKALVVRNIEVESTTLDAERIAAMVMTIFTGLCIEQNSNPDPEQLQQKISDFMQMLRSL